ncbi:MAG: hypothetical protein KDE47_03530 [Caldilineaceae bacterium]|nr:hypothetical protein [Caldilineaceae bacterium]MCB9156564.1 hypothetical protein [Caldilineaceae bacterium]
MKKLDELRAKLQPGRIYHRKGLARWSKAVDRHLKQLLDDGALVKLSQGIYYCPRQTAFGEAPPDEKALVRAFLNDERFLITSPNVYNVLGIGATQLYNQTVVYNHKRHGKLSLGNRTFDFRKKSFFPLELNREFLLVDLVNNLGRVAEERTALLNEVEKQLPSFDRAALTDAVRTYGGVAAKKFFAQSLGDDSLYYGN